MKKVNQITAFLLGMLSLAALQGKAQNNTLLIDPNDHSWYASSYGKSDEIGAANLITSTSILQAVKLVKKGITVPLAVPVSKQLPAFRHRICYRIMINKTTHPHSSKYGIWIRGQLRDPNKSPGSFSFKFL